MCMIHPAMAPLRAVAVPLIPFVWAFDKLWGHRIKVSRTRIFARREGDEQFVVYSMRLSSRAESVMVLPIPVDQAVDEEAALEFIDLGGYPKLFEDINECFNIPFEPSRSRGGISFASMPPQTLKVHEVGAYDASFVPSIADFVRLDERFRLPEHVWDALPEYADYGFAVFKLGKGRDQEFHPMAFRFRTRDAQLFFPTVHVHDGKVHPRAQFEHELFFQMGTTEPVEILRSKEISVNGASKRAMQGHQHWGDDVRFEDARGVVDPDQDIFKLSLHGKLDNTDQRIEIGR